MINLIPPYARKQVKVEYWVRAVSVWLLLSAVSVVIVGILMVPSYVLIRAQLSIYKESYTQASAQDSSYRELEDAVSQANKTAQQLQSVSSDQDISLVNLITEIENLAGSNIFLKSITMKREVLGNVDTIQVLGISKSRASLAGFRDQIEARDSFARAGLPLSNLAKDKDVQFNITITTSVAE